MAAYGRGDYSGGAYSIGAYLGALAIVSASTVAISGDKIKDAQFEISSTSTVSIGAVKIASASVDIVDTSEITVAGGISAGGGFYVGNTSTISVSNTSTSASGAHLTFENPTGGQSVVAFNFAGVTRASIRVDNGGNLIINANNNNIYL